MTISAPSELWKAVRTNSGKSSFNDSSKKFLVDPDRINRFFANVSVTKDYTVQDVLNMRKDSTVQPDEQDSVVATEYDIEYMLSHLKNSSPGIDEIPSWVFKNCSVEVAEIIAYIINKTIESGKIPDNWKVAIVTPIPKLPNPKSISDYRPISVTPILSRIAEKFIVNNYLKPALPVENLQDQYAYKFTGSTNCALIQTLNFISASLDCNSNNQRVGAIAIDFSKAFDTVDHVILLNKLCKLKIPNSVYNWIISFLTNRRQIVRIGADKSNIENINLGIVQGSVLGPFLFIIMLSDLSPISIDNCIVKYADDTTLLVPESSRVTLRQEYHNVKNYAKDNKMKINEKKTKYMLFSNPRFKGGAIDIFDEIEFVKKMKLLGVTLDNKLSFHDHVSFVLSVCSQRFYLLKLLRDQGMPLHCLHVVYVSLVVNRIAYCLSAWGGNVKQDDADKINSLFRKAKKYGFTDTIFDFGGLLEYYDENMFTQIQYSNHCLHHLLQSHRQGAMDLRDRGHRYSLPKCINNVYKNSCIPRLLFKNINV